MNRPTATTAEANHSTPELTIPMKNGVQKELEWFFSYAEDARRAGAIAFLPMHERLRNAAANDDAVHKRGTELVTAIERTLADVPEQHAGVLRALYTPRRWPSTVTRVFTDVAPIAVRLICASNPWPPRTSKAGLEEAAARKLAVIVTKDRPLGVTVRKRARALKRRAVAAYERAREASANAKVQP